MYFIYQIPTIKIGSGPGDENSGSGSPKLTTNTGMVSEEPGLPEPQSTI
jgi:hypothetical protein